MNWLASFEVLVERIRVHFARTEVRHRCRSYLLGLLSLVERKNVWQLAKYTGDSHRVDSNGTGSMEFRSSSGDL
jgi:hypothetical protein